MKNFLAFLFGLLIALLLLEAGLRAFNPVGMRVRGDRIVLPANTVYEFRDVQKRGLEPHIVHSKNSLGFRGPEPSPADSIRILAVGGSTTECFYLSDGRDWPAQVMELLRPDFPGLWVNNAGLDGHSTYGHLILLEDYLLGMRPDIILFKTGLNDISWRAPPERNHPVIRGPVRFNSPGAFLTSLVSRSETVYVAYHLHRVWQARKSAVHHQFIDFANAPQTEIDHDAVAFALDYYGATTALMYRQRLEALVGKSLEAGILPVLITHAALAGDHTDPITGADFARMEVRGASGYQLGAVIGLFNDITRDVAALHAVPLIDLALHMERSSALFYDHFHYTVDGSQRAAQIIGEALKPVIASF